MSVKIKQSSSDRVFDAVLIMISVVIMVLVAYPLYFVVIASVSNPSAVLNGRVFFWPVGFNFESY